MKLLGVDDFLFVDKNEIGVLPTALQLMNKDIKELYNRDKTTDKYNFKRDIGIIYMLGDVKSSINVQGLSGDEAYKEIAMNFSMPNNLYKPDDLILRCVENYKKKRYGAAGAALFTLYGSLHNIAKAADFINKSLAEKLEQNPTIEDIPLITQAMAAVDAQITRLPKLSQALEAAKAQLIDEQELTNARGGVGIISSMSASDYDL